MTQDDYNLIESWINAVGNVPDACGYDFPYAEGWETACVALLAQMDDHKRKQMVTLPSQG